MNQSPATLIMGASRGIGLELARQSVAAGERVIATARDDAGLERLRALGCQALRLDVADPVSVSGLAWQIDGIRLRAAWYVAGVICNRANATQPPAQQEFDRVMHTNVLGAMQLIAQVAPALAASGASGVSGASDAGGAGGVLGRFGFISSGMGQIGTAGSSDAWLYRVSKAALNMAAVSARHSYPGVLFAVFHPGWVQTDMGGAQAPVTAQESASGLRATLARLGPEHNGGFFNHRGASMQGW